MIVLFTLAQLADAFSMRPDFEANRLVLILGDSAYLAKLALIVLVVSVALALSRTRYRWVRVPLLGVGTVVGLIGFASNVI